MIQDILSNGIVIAVVAVIIVLFVAVGAVASRYKIASTDEAYIVNGRKGEPVKNPETGEISTDLSGQKVVIGGGVFVLPFIQEAHLMSLRSRKIPLQISGVLSQNNVLLNIEGVALIKVGGTEDDVRAAAQRFLGQQEGIEHFATETLNGSLRAIVGGMTVEQIIRDRTVLASKVRDEAETSLTNQGLVIDTLQIQSVSDDNNYIHNLSRPEAARADRDAKIAEAEARQASAEREAVAAENIAIAEKNLALKKAAIKAETDRELARADASGPLSKAAQDQEVLAAEEQVAVRQAELTARELESSVNKPAEAARYRVVQEAEAEKAKSIAEAQAKAEALRLSASAELEQRKALAEAVRAEGEAEAAAILARGQAEAEALEKKAIAYQKYNEAAVTQMLVDVLPKVAAEIAGPLGNIENMTVISNDGASKLTNTTTDILSQVLTVAKDLTGLDLSETLTSKVENDKKLLTTSDTLNE